MNEELIRQAVARGWCHPANSHKEMDSDLANAIALEVWKVDTTPNLGCATSQEMIDELKARVVPEMTIQEYLDYRTIDSH